MAKKKNMINISAEWNDLLDLLSFEESGKIFYLIRKFESLTSSALTVLEAGMELSNQAAMIWNSIKTELANMIEAKKAKSAKAAASARARWGSKEPESGVPGQEGFKYVITSDSDRPEVHANVMRTQCERNANASPIYNNINKLNNTHIYNECEIVKLFLENGSTEAEAKKYFRFYSKRHWMTYYGKKITDVAYSVKRWIERNAEHNERKSNASSPIQVHTTAATSRTAKRKTPVFCDIEQRTYNYDELLLQING